MHQSPRPSAASIAAQRLPALPPERQAAGQGCVQPGAPSCERAAVLQTCWQRCLPARWRRECERDPLPGAVLGLYHMQKVLMRRCLALPALKSKPTQMSDRHVDSLKGMLAGLCMQASLPASTRERHSPQSAHSRCQVASARADSADGCWAWGRSSSCAGVDGWAACLAACAGCSPAGNSIWSWRVQRRIGLCTFKDAWHSFNIADAFHKDVGALRFNEEWASCIRTSAGQYARFLGRDIKWLNGP